MQLIADGPYIPDEVRVALEADELVLFCGAGVSMPATSGGPGLPGFGQLVDRVFSEVGETKRRPEIVACVAGSYDRALHLLESRVAKPLVRATVFRILSADGPFDRHRSILRLAKLRDGGVRMVTTNFDRQFERAAVALGMPITIHECPGLPVPKAWRWRSLVHLHGRIAPDADERHPSLQDLVYTSGDFGRAYLTEGWAARFVTKLFEDHPVLFVGYSVDDPVMRYLMDAFAAERAAASANGKSSPPAWAFAGYEDGKQDEVSDDWLAKGINPILYRIGPGHDHSSLYATLVAWADRKDQGLDGRIRLAEEAANIIPSAPYRGPAMDGVRWALRDEAAARSFAAVTPPPPAEWLPALYEWGLLSVRHEDSAVPLQRVANGSENTAVPPIPMAMLAWLVRHLDSPAVLEWVLEGGMPHPSLQHLIRHKLSQPRAPVGTTPTLGQRGPLHPELERAWMLVASATARAPGAAFSERAGFAALVDRAADDRVARAELLRQLSPVLRLRTAASFRAFRAVTSPASVPAATRLVTSVTGEVELACEDLASSILTRIQAHERRGDLLAAMADDLTSLLKTALDLFALADRANAERDPFTWLRRSVADADPDEGSEVLVALVRDAMPALHDADRDAAEALLDRWKTIRYPTFGKLVLHELRRTL